MSFHRVVAELPLITLTLWLQSAGVAALIAWVRPALEGDAHKIRGLRSAALIVRFTAAVVVLHGLEILLWACFYRWRCLPSWDSAIYFSVSSYSTLGCNDLSLPSNWRTLGPLESVIGVLMCGISVSLLFAIVTRLSSRNATSLRRNDHARCHCCHPSWNSKRFLCAFIFAGCVAIPALGQHIAAPDPKPGKISGTVTDLNDDIVPGANVILERSARGDKRSMVSGDNGSFTFDDLKPGVPYHITISPDGFVTWTSPAIMISPSQIDFLTGIKLEIATGATSVTVYASSEQIAAEQVKIEERQRVFGIIPNFYVVYDQNAAPLTTKLKFRLALKASTDPVFFAANALVAGAQQAGDTPNYVQGAMGYGQRFGASYATGFTDIMVGEAILPSLLRQDPRYFYQGTGTKRSRVFHALSSPFICKGDNGKWEPNYSTVGGDLAAGAVSNLYYPQSNRGAGTVFENSLITAGGRMANGLVQEFILRRFTPSARHRTQ
jgi:Carboxypeptidase regulatory-like domain